jgi:hypothetical protein
MARLLPGENSKIDMINENVRLVQQGNSDESNESLSALLDLFRPLTLRLCKKWSDYFNGIGCTVKSINELVDDSAYWFYHYTKNVYIIDGKATYNKFIKDHMDQRIRYMCEQEIKYYNTKLFPDPYTDGSDSDSDIFENIVSKYATNIIVDISDSMIDDEYENAQTALCNKLISIMGCDIFNDRERDIFTSIVCNQQTHEQLGDKYGISRTRVTQILAKIKDKLYKQIEGDAEVWQLLDDAEIDITNPKLMK